MMVAANISKTQNVMCEQATFWYPRSQQICTPDPVHGALCQSIVVHKLLPLTRSYYGAVLRVLGLSMGNLKNRYLL